ncbi:hypothetical protein ILYODFUR_036101 [Ilyodon furcidens]|uniref:Uncharacterized protein n=1 Tax=Ilyodon furcidens TaxID=33524 RepID=A0ABV0T323_9TELE
MKSHLVFLENIRDATRIQLFGINSPQRREQINVTQTTRSSTEVEALYCGPVFMEQQGVKSAVFQHDSDPKPLSNKAVSQGTGLHVLEEAAQASGCSSKIPAGQNRSELQNQ